MRNKIIVFVCIVIMHILASVILQTFLIRNELQEIKQTIKNSQTVYKHQIKDGAKIKIISQDTVYEFEFINIGLK